jgi:hypothetical protein
MRRRRMRCRPPGWSTSARDTQRSADAQPLVAILPDGVGLVAGRRRGREVRCAVRPERLDDAAEAMARAAAQWDGRLARIKRLAESVQAEAESI